MDLPTNCPNKLYFTEERLKRLPLPCAYCKTKDCTNQEAAPINTRQPYIPSEIKTGGLVFAVVKTKGDPLLVKNRACQARITYGKALIELDEDTLEVPQSQARDLCHEIIHSWVDDRRLEIPEDIEEHIVDSLGRSLYQFLTDNDLWFKPKTGLPEITGTITLQPGPGESMEDFKDKLTATLLQAGKLPLDCGPGADVQPDPMITVQEAADSLSAAVRSTGHPTGPTTDDYVLQAEISIPQRPGVSIRAALAEKLRQMSRHVEQRWEASVGQINDDIGRAYYDIKEPLGAGK